MHVKIPIFANVRNLRHKESNIIYHARESRSQLENVILCSHVDKNTAQTLWQA